MLQSVAMQLMNGARGVGLPPLGSVREKSVVPPGLESFLTLYPALPRWAKLVRPSGARRLRIPCTAVAQPFILTHALCVLADS